MRATDDNRNELKCVWSHQLAHRPSVMLDVCQSQIIANPYDAPPASRGVIIKLALYTIAVARRILVTHMHKHEHATRWPHITLVILEDNWYPMSVLIDPPDMAPIITRERPTSQRWR